VDKTVKFTEAYTAARQFYRQELRFHKKRHQLPDESPQELVDETYASLTVHAAARALGLYRNACLTLACCCFIHEDFRSAYEYLLDVMFLDINGASNSHLPEFQFNRGTAEINDFVASILRGVVVQLDLRLPQVEPSFIDRWQRFSAFPNPPTKPEAAWKKLSRRIR
jgi:hypothetical protein